VVTLQMLFSRSHRSASQQALPNTQCVPLRLYDVAALRMGFEVSSLVFISVKLLIIGIYFSKA